MIIGKIWDCEYPWDVRVEKVTSSLMEAGHQVHLFCRNRKAEPELGKLGELTVHRMPNRLGAGSRIEDVSSFPAFINPRWARFVLGASRTAKVELLLCRDLPLAPLALWVGRRLKVPVVVDIAENYPAMLRHRFNRRDFRLHNLVARNPYLAAAVERFVMPRADGVIAVVEESRARLESLGTPPERLVTVCNTPTTDRIDALGKIAETRRSTEGPLRLVYLGLIGHSRGVDTVVEALKTLKESSQRVHFDVIGEDREDRVRAQVAAVGVEEMVTLHGRLPYDDALQLVARADVGVVPHYATEHWNTTIPNKLFDYMACALPVLVSDAPPTQRIVREVGAGLVFRSQDAEDLAVQVGAMGDAALRRKFGEAGRRAVLEQYNWEKDGEILVSFLESVHSRFESLSDPGASEGWQRRVSSSETPAAMPSRG